MTTLPDVPTVSRPIDEAIVHCSATKAEWMAGRPTSEKVAEITRWHVEGNGWSDNGYHFLIDRDGTIATGRRLSKIGAHVKGHNDRTVGICLLGGFGSESTDEFRQHFTVEQDRSLRALLQRLQAVYPSITKVTGHNQYAAKACPGFQVGPWWRSSASVTEKPVPPKNEADPLVMPDLTAETLDKIVLTLHDPHGNSLQCRVVPPQVHSAMMTIHRYFKNAGV